MKLSEVIGVNQVCSQIIIDQPQIPVPVGIKINRILAQCEPSMLYYREEITRIIHAYCELDENGEAKHDTEGNFIFKNEETANQEFEALENTEVGDLPRLFSIDDFDGLLLPYEDIQSISLVTKL